MAKDAHKEKTYRHMYIVHNDLKHTENTHNMAEKWMMYQKAKLHVLAHCAIELSEIPLY